VVEVARAIEDHLGNARSLGPLGDEFANGLGGRDVGTGLEIGAQILLEARSRRWT
jgi:hypothetical protein